MRNRQVNFSPRKRRKLYGFLAALLLWPAAFAFLAAALPQEAAAQRLFGGETRSLKIYFTHTQEREEVVYKKNGRYVRSGLKRLNYLLRDWRRAEAVNMDPRLFDTVWQIYQISGSHDYIHVVSGYRSPRTNNMLRLSSPLSGVAEHSRHMQGKAMDFYLPDVNLAYLRAIALKLQGGGIGYYPNSGSPFVHVDVGNVRHWPRLSARALAALFPDGKSMHMAADGRRLAHYAEAVAEYQARGNVSLPVSSARALFGSQSARQIILAAADGHMPRGQKSLGLPPAGAAEPPVLMAQAQEPMSAARLGGVKGTPMSAARQSGVRGASAARRSDIREVSAEQSAELESLPFAFAIPAAVPVPTPRFAADAEEEADRGYIEETAPALIASVPVPQFKPDDDMGGVLAFASAGAGLEPMSRARQGGIRGAPMSERSGARQGEANKQPLSGARQGEGFIASASVPVPTESPRFAAAGKQAGYIAETAPALMASASASVPVPQFKPDEMSDILAFAPTGAARDTAGSAALRALSALAPVPVPEMKPGR